MQLAQINERLEKLEDAVIDQIIDADNFAKRKQKLLLQLATIKKSQAKTQQMHQSPAVIGKFLERLKNLGAHYYNADPAEKRVIVEIATSNRSVKDKNVYVEPANWLLNAQHAMSVLYCAESRTTSRTDELGQSELRNEIPDCLPVTLCAEHRTTSRTFDSNETHHVEQLVEAAHSPEANRLFQLFMDGYRNAAGIGAAQSAITPRKLGSYTKSCTDHANQHGL
ncbi:MAG: hypothetical protein COA78_28175 [Blastopirellula sp.]|nr:MAG: hypothetical protein COA78_28175 [Blastopirellula sp.]